MVSFFLARTKTSLFHVHTKYISPSDDLKYFSKISLLIVEFADTAASYESGHLHKLLGIKSEGHDDL